MAADNRRHACVLGTQWGDEGKGKIVDVLSDEYDAVVRFQGGANAGHTVKFEGAEHILHLLPSGILRPGKLAVLGNGMVIDPVKLVDEIAAIRRAGVDTDGRLFIGDRAHVVMPFHRIFDQAREEQAGAGKIGTTLRGIGPCYEDKVARRGVRMGDLVDLRALRARLESLLPGVNTQLEHLYGRPPLDLEEVWRKYSRLGEELKPLVVDVTQFLYDLDRRGRRLLFEGAQGALLDIDLGTYPYVTSSNTCLSAVGTGCGFSPRRLGEVVGVVKAYATRVGAGPFPSEAPPPVAEMLREQGGEYGATTGRPRRCGWLDMVALKYALWTSDVDTVVLTKLDVLDTLPEIRVAVAYRSAAGDSMPFPADLEHTAPQIEWRTFPGWRQSIGDCRTFEDLPEACRAYVSWISETTGCPLRIISVGGDRAQVIRFEPPLRPGSVE